MNQEYCLQTRNHEGKEVIFTEKQHISKIRKRAELRDPKFIKGLMKDTIQSPDFIYLDLTLTRHALYKVRYTINGKSRYIKVVVNPHVSPIFIVTAYMPDYVKERGKTTLIYGKDNI